MAYQMIHLEIAYRLLERMNLKDARKEFILGSIAPDSVHFRKPYRVEDKIHTHFFEGCGQWGNPDDYELWIENMKAFWNKYGSNENDVKMRMFILGIYVHGLTDYYNDVLVWREVLNKYVPPMTGDEFRNSFYSEAQLIDKWLFQNSENTDEICKLLIAADEIDLDDYIYADDLKRMKKHLLENQYNLSEGIDISNYKYYTLGILKDFIKVVTDKVFEIICSEV